MPHGIQASPTVHRPRMFAARQDPRTTPTLLRTAADFDAVPDDALLVTIEVVFPEVPHARKRTIWRKFGREFVNLDPSDRVNGERSEPSGYLENLLTGFGNSSTVPGVAVLLGEGEEVAPETVTSLAPGTIIMAGSEEAPFVSQGGDTWTFCDPGDPYDGEYPTTTANLISGETSIRVLYRPGDEITAGFTLEPTPEQKSEAPDAANTVRAREQQDIEKMTPCAREYVAEFGHLPRNRAEQDRYSTFRFGFERGQRNGAAGAYAEIAKYAKERS